MELILGTSDAFLVEGATLFLKNNMDANGNTIINLPAASDDSAAVPYSQVSHLIKSLDHITPGAPTAVDKRSFIRVACPTITDPFGGFYLFYWCTDSSASTQITISGNSVVASSGATINFDGSVANIVNVIKDKGLEGSYFHVAVRYRNFNHLSNLSVTGHLLVEVPTAEDILINHEDAPLPRNESMVIGKNRIFINANPGPLTPPGCSYIAQILFDSSPLTKISGTEANLVRISSSTPAFSYDVPLMQSQYPWVHARIASVSIFGIETFTPTMHSALDYSVDFINDAFLNLMAHKMADMIQTQAGEPLAAK